MLPSRSPLASTDTSSDLEALQTDVMRFLAILCLCLVAISTLVIPSEEVESPTIEAEAIKPAPTSELSHEESSEGFDISFASKEALLDLVSRGRVQLYAIVGARLWVYSPRAKAFKPSSSGKPRYAIERSDLPQVIIDRLPSFTGGELLIGLTLPEDTAKRVHALTAQYAGGSLVITASGQVRRLAAAESRGRP